LKNSIKTKIKISINTIY